MTWEDLEPIREVLERIAEALEELVRLNGG